MSTKVTRFKFGEDLRIMILKLQLQLFTISLFLYILLIQIVSNFRQLNSVTLLLALLISVAIGFALFVIEYKKQELNPSTEICIREHGAKRTLFVSTRLKFFATAPIIMVLIILLVTALFAPPNNWDSMTYHLPRIENWLQNNSVFGLVSQIDRQIWSPKWTHMLFLLPASLSSSDHILNLLQFTSLIIILTLLFNFARSLHLTYLQALLPVYLVLAFPTFLLESVTTQNDVISALIVLVSVLSFLNLLHEPKSMYSKLRFSAALALCCGAKGTTLILVPILSILAIYFLSKKGDLTKSFIIVTFPSILLNGQNWFENYRLYKSPLSPKFAPEIDPLITDLNPFSFVSNIIRLFTSNLLLIPQNFNESIVSLSNGVQEFLRLDPNNPGNTWSGGFNPIIGLHEDFAASPILVGLVTYSIFITFLHWRNKGEQTSDTRYLLTVSFFYLAATIYLLRWQPWINRLLLPTYLLMVVALVPIIKEKFNNTERYSKKVFSAFVVALMFLYSSIFTLFTTDRPLLPIGSRTNTIFNLTDSQLRFINQPWIESDYINAIQKIKDSGARTIYLNLGSNSWEYPLWYYLKQYDQNIKIKSILEFDETKLDKKERAAIVCIDVCTDKGSNVIKILINSDD